MLCFEVDDGDHDDDDAFMVRKRHPMPMSFKWPLDGQAQEGGEL